MREKLVSSLKILGLLWVVSFIVASLFGTGDMISGNVAVVPIHGIIAVTGDGFSSDIAGSDEVISRLDEAASNPQVEAIILDINSPGGSGVASDEIGQKIKSINKTTVAVIREVGASGGYWIASSADYVFANRMSLTGSIGVIGSYLEFSGFMEEHNITYQRFVSGQFKDMGSAFRQPTEEEEELWQQIIDEMEQMFIQEVADNRNLPVSYVEELATGQIYLGSQAKENGLVDELGTKTDAIAYIENTLNITARPVEYKKKASFADFFSLSIEDRIAKFIYPAAPSLR